MKLVLIGIQGAGKSTQGNRLSKQLGVPYLSTGHIFRQLAREKTKTGRYIKEVMNTGLLISDDKTIDIVEKYLSRREYKRGYILDGFPRTIKQAKKFKNNVDKVIHIDLPEREALWRISHRNDTTRADENLAGIRKRIDLFKKVTTPVIEYYRKQNKLIEVDGRKSRAKVNKQILKGLGRQLVKNKLKVWQRRKKIILAIIGLYGSGKSEAAKYLSKKDLPIVHFGSVVNKRVEKQGLTHTEENHRKIREAIRKEYGMEAMAVLNRDKIKTALKDRGLIVIDGLRSFEEYDYLHKQFEDVEIRIIAIWASEKTRKSRIGKRRYNRALRGKKRDINEVLYANMGPTIALADHIVVNESSLEDFHYRLENIYREIYYS